MHVSKPANTGNAHLLKASSNTVQLSHNLSECMRGSSKHEGMGRNTCLIAWQLKVLIKKVHKQSNVSIFPDWCRYSKLDLKPADRPTVHYGAHRDVSMQSQNKHKLLNLLIMFVK